MDGRNGVQDLRIFSMGLVMLISFIGVQVFDLLSLPMPWMLGPLFAVLISQFFVKYELYWPVSLRNIGLIIIGTSIGQAFIFDLFKGMGWLIFYMLLFNISLLIVTVLMAFGIQKLANISLKTALTSTVPGGLSQIVSFAEEEKDVDLAVATYFHVVRVISIVMLIPFILSAHVVKPIEQNDLSISFIGSLTLLLIICTAMVWIGKKIKLPVPYFMSPVLFILFLKFLSIETPEIPSWLLQTAQLFMGAYIGLLLKPHMIKLGNRVLLLGAGSALLILAITFVQGWIIKSLLGYSLPTSFLSTAAGGLDQMSLLATAVGADISTVTVFQLFRLLFVFLLVLPLLKVACTYIDRREEKMKKHSEPVQKSSIRN